jgi:hypothetical protein
MVQVRESFEFWNFALTIYLSIEQVFFKMFEDIDDDDDESEIEFFPFNSVRLLLDIN